MIFKLYKALCISLSGLKSAWQHEFAFRLECLLSLLFLPLACFIGSNKEQIAILVMSWLLVPIMELLNSGIEAAIDRISKEQHELSKRAKDFGSAAVFLAIVNAVVIWLLILLF